MTERNEELCNPKQRSKTLILRRSVTEPKITHTRINRIDDPVVPLFSRRFTIPYKSERNTDTDSQSSGFDCSKSSSDSAKGRSWIRSRFSKQQSVGVKQGWDESSVESSETNSTCSFKFKDRPSRPTSEKISSKRSSRVRPVNKFASTDLPIKPLETVLPTIENKHEHVSDAWASSRRGSNQTKRLQSDSFEAAESRLSPTSASTRQSHTGLDVHTVLEYTTQQMDNLFAAKHFDATELARLRGRSMDSVLPSSKEYSLVIGQINGENDINNNYETIDAVKKTSRKRWNSLKTKFKVKNAFVRAHSIRVSQFKLSVENLETMEENQNKDTERKKPKVPMSRGWLLVKANLSQIAEMAPPPRGIDSKPKLNIRHFAELVKAKEFRLLMKRRASFIENGKFQYEEAKADLFSRYPLPSAADDQIVESNETYKRTAKRQNFIKPSQ